MTVAQDPKTRYHERKNTKGRNMIRIILTVAYSNEPFEETQQEPSGRFGGGEKNAEGNGRGSFFRNQS